MYLIKIALIGKATAMATKPENVDTPSNGHKDINPKIISKGAITKVLIFVIVDEILLISTDIKLMMSPDELFNLASLDKFKVFCKPKM